MQLAFVRSVYLTAEKGGSFLGEMHPCLLIFSFLGKLIWLLIRECTSLPCLKLLFEEWVKLRSCESQNHKIINAGKDLWRLPSWIPLLKAETARTGYSGLCPVGY